MKILYISYDGILEPLGQSQILRYVVGLSLESDIVLLTFEKPQDLRQRERVWEMKRLLSATGVRWVKLSYHKWPPILSTLWDGIVGTLVGLWINWRSRVQIVHARGYVPALMAWFIKKLTGLKFLFDMRRFWADEKLEGQRIYQQLKVGRKVAAPKSPGGGERNAQDNVPRFLFAMEGFWADEKVAGGHWSERDAIYRIAKRCEKLFFESADAIVSLTVAGAEAIPGLGYAVPARTPVEVIPTCTDLERFTPAPKDQALLARLGLEERVVFGCVGTISNWYLRRPMLDYLCCLIEHFDRATILMVTREDHQQLKADAMRAGIPPDRLVLTQAEFASMPAYVGLIDVGVFFIRACFGKKGSAATKLGEFLACGVPVIINEGVGDSGWIVKQHRVGVVLDDVTPEDFECSLPAVRNLLTDPGLTERCRNVAVQYFDLRTGTKKYVDLYQKLMRQGVSLAEPIDR